MTYAIITAGIFVWLVGLWLLRRRIARRWLRWTLRTAVVLLLLTPATLAIAGGGYWWWFTHRAQPAPVQQTLAPGITYTRLVVQQPRPLVIHRVVVDLDTPGLRFITTPPEPANGHHHRAMRTTDFLARHNATVAINANFFSPFHWYHPLDYYPHPGDPVSALGIAASSGDLYSPDPWIDGPLYISREGRPTFKRPEATPWNAISGAGFLLSDGKVRNHLPPGNHPRAAVGLDRDEKRLFFIAIDGNQPNYSEGASLIETAEFLRDWSAWDAIQLDGGGSASLAHRTPQGHPALLNTPANFRIPGWERAVANHLGIRIDPTTPPPATAP